VKNNSSRRGAGRPGAKEGPSGAGDSAAARPDRETTKMKLLDFISAKAVLPAMKATDRDSALVELVEALRDAGLAGPSQVKPLVDALTKREQLGSTGIGKGIAVPHAKHASVKQVIGAVGRSATGIEFNALDGAPVYLLFLIISPPDAGSDHLRALERVSALIRNDDFNRFLRTAPDAQGMVDVLKEVDES